MKTPHLDRLAKEGVTFSRHYIQAPTCGPSRYSLLTGLRPKYEAELNNNFMELNFHKRPVTDRPETFVHHFLRHGYTTVGIGKISHTPDGRIRKDKKTLELPYSWDEMICEKGVWGGGFDTFFAYACEIRHAYFAAVSYVDAQIGKVLNALEDLDLAKNTIVVVWGDHGWHLGDHTIWGKHSPFERSANSPLMIRVPGMKSAGARSDALIETIDLYPTLCELTGIEPPPDLEGKSITTILHDPDTPGKSAVYTYQRNRISMRTDRFRLIVHETGDAWIVALFDHQTDPNETRNIAGTRPEIVNQLLPLLNKGNTGMIPKLERWEPKSN